MQFKKETISQGGKNLPVNHSEVIIRFYENMKKNHEEISRKVESHGKFDRIGMEVEETFAGELTRFFGRSIFREITIFFPRPSGRPRAAMQVRVLHMRGGKARYTRAPRDRPT